MSSKKLNPFKDFQSDQIQRSSRKIFTAHYACRNAALNLTPVTGTTNGFIFQIINSLIESWGVCLTCLDCNNLTCWKTGLMWEVNVQHCYSTPFAAVLHYELHVFCCPVCHTIKWSGTQIKLYNLRAPHKNVPWEKEMGITPGTFLLALCLSFVICVDLNSPKTTKQYNLLFCKPLLKLFYSW